MKCIKCGNEIGNEVKFCRYCGTSIFSKTDNLQMATEKKKTKSFGKIVIIFLLIVVVASVGAGAFYFKPWEYESWQEFFERDEVDESDKSQHEKDREEGKEVEVEVEDTEEYEEDVEYVEEDEIVDDEEVDAAEEDEMVDDTWMEYVEEDNMIEILPVDMDCITEVYATSSLSEYDMTHSPNRVIDGNTSTAWVEGVKGNGLGESVAFLLDDTYMMSGFEIYTGYQKDSDRYYKNARPKEISVSFSDGTSQIFELKDMMGVQKIQLVAPVETNSIKITIRSVYSGNKYEDTVISEIEFY